MKPLFYTKIDKLEEILKLIHRDISSAYFFLIVDLRERGTRFVLTLFMRHYFSGQIILELILTIQNMEICYRKPGSLANINVNCIGLSLVTQPMLQRRPNPTELRSMDSYIQILCRFQKCKRKVPSPSPLWTLSTKK